MFKTLLFLMIIVFGYSQLNVVGHPTFPSYTAANLYGIEVTDDGGEAIICMYDTAVRIIKVNMTDGTTITTYTPAVALPSNSGYTHLHRVKNYLIASSLNANTLNPIILDLTSLTLLGQFDRGLAMISCKYIQSRDIIVFGSHDGKVFYSSLSTFPNPTSTEIYNIANTLCQTFIDVSTDQKYLSVVYRNNTALVIFYVSDFSIVHTAVTDCIKNTQIWSPDSRYVVVFPYCHSTFTLYDSNSSWTSFQKFPAQSDIEFSFNYLETNTLVMVPLSNNLIVTMNWYDFSLSNIGNLTFAGKYGKVAKTNSMFGVFMQSQFKSWFFQINAFCGDYFGYKTSTKACVPCSSNCIKCTDTTVCTRCDPNYTLLNSACQPCGPNTIYNSTTFLCDDVSTLCSGDQYFSIPLMTCIQCQPHCTKCSSTTTCQTCHSSYVLNNGVCDSVPCTLGQFYNFINSSCSSCSFNCLECLSSTQCVTCASDAVLVNGACTANYEIAFQQFVKHTLQNDAIKFTNKIPGNRVLFSQIFSFFINIDHLWLYIYHKRPYGSVINNFLRSVNLLEQQKWQLINKDSVFQRFGMPMQQIESDLDFKKNETSWKFLQIEDQSSSFLSNTISFFFLNVPLVLFVYLFFRGVFMMTFFYQISSFFREYVFDLFFFYMLIEGNIESFTYYIFYDYLDMVSLRNTDKIINLVTLFLSFLLIFYIFAGQVIIYITEGKNSKYFMKDFKVNLDSVFFATFHIAIVNFCLGACHILAENYYKGQLTLLAIIEAAYCALLAFTMKSKNIFTQKYVGWQYFFGSLIRIVLILTFSIDKDSQGQVRQLMNFIQMVLIILYLFNWILSIFIGYGELFRNLVKYLIHKFQPLGVKSDMKLKEEDFSFNHTLFRPKFKPSRKIRESVRMENFEDANESRSEFQKVSKIDSSEQISLFSDEKRRSESKGKAGGFRVKNVSRLKNFNFQNQMRKVENEMKESTKSTNDSSRKSAMSQSQRNSNLSQRKSGLMKENMPLKENRVSKFRPSVSSGFGPKKKISVKKNNENE